MENGNALGLHPHGAPRVVGFTDVGGRGCGRCFMGTGSQFGEMRVPEMMVLTAAQCERAPFLKFLSKRSGS